MNTLKKITEKIYTWFALLTMGLGFFVALVFIVSLLIGGSAGESLAVLSGKMMTWGIRLATIATIAGILNIYLSKQHTLTMNVQNSEDIEVPTNEQRM
ncbi:hypothetical protein AB3N04_13535 [Alkalihalophilus sp. As8PL]|uniref:Uncharacterized protein n=1 Tax=Alkalihalophilus sp. As8PL TaxID=3237103 RepID=A0AB39BPH7_9BACI